MSSLLLCLLASISAKAAKQEPSTPAEILTFRYSLESNASQLFLGDDAMVDTIHSLLDAIYSAQPSIDAENYSVSLSYQPNYILLAPQENTTLSKALALINGTVYTNNTIDFAVGVELFDTINAAAGMWSITKVSYSWGDWYVLRYANGWINVEELQRRYAEVDSVEFAELNRYIGGSTRDIVMERSDAAYEFTFIKRWGDCLAGCISSSSQTCTVTTTDLDGAVRDVMCESVELPFTTTNSVDGTVWCDDDGDTSDTSCGDNSCECAIGARCEVDACVGFGNPSQAQGHFVSALPTAMSFVLLLLSAMF